MESFIHDASVSFEYIESEKMPATTIGSTLPLSDAMTCWYLPITVKNLEHRLRIILPTKRFISELEIEIISISASSAAILLESLQMKQSQSTTPIELEILAMAIQNGSDSMLVTDRHNKIIKVNDAFVRTFGYQENEVLGKQPTFLSSMTQENPLFHDTWNTLLKEKHWSKEIWVKGNGEKIFPAWVSISAITDSHNKIQNFLAVFTDLSALRESQKKSLRLAYYDQLTGLPNRQKIVADLQKKAFTACVIFNIDHFKEINDFYGIEIGDRILKEVAQWLGTMNFSPYRISGDEFAILFDEEVTWIDLRSRIRALLTLFEEKIFFIDEETISLQMTAGASIGYGKLLTRADIALNRARKSKKNIALYAEHENIEETYRSNIQMSSTIRMALAKSRVVCHYQPIMNLETQTIQKYETLVRIENQDGTLILPTEFLPIAKKSKLYPQITLAVIHQACHAFASREEEFSINLSESDIRDSRVVQEIINTIVKTNTASRIVFEILESEGIENYQEVTEFIHQVKNLGAKIAIDDFGTGYSNFENILKLNVDYIKIDGSLIQGIIDNPMHHIVVETIVNFAHRIGAKTIAEYVSSPDIYREVNALGVDFAQGYYTGRPDPLT